MIKIDFFKATDINYIVTYVEDVRVLTITSNYMDDNASPNRESTGCLVWLNNENIICELECIYPTLISKGVYFEDSGIVCEIGTPTVNVKYENRGTLLHLTETYCEIVFCQGKTPDKKCICSNLIIYIAGNQVLSIVCTDIKIFETEPPIETYD